MQSSTKIFLYCLSSVVIFIVIHSMLWLLLKIILLCWEEGWYSWCEISWTGCPKTHFWFSEMSSLVKKGAIYWAEKYWKKKPSSGEMSISLGHAVRGIIERSFRRCHVGRWIQDLVTLVEGEASAWCIHVVVTKAQKEIKTLKKDRIA